MGLFRLSRMRELTTTDIPFMDKHENVAQLLAEYAKRDNRQYLQVKMLCQPEIRISVEEYFSNATITEKPSGEWLFEFDVPENERGWFGILMSFGEKIKVLEPEKHRKNAPFSIKNWWWEPGVMVTAEMSDALEACLQDI